MTWLWVALGGAMGSTLRWVLLQLMAMWPGPQFLWPTLLVNLLGCFFTGLFLGCMQRAPEWWSGVDPAVRIGLLGGFTTFSALAADLHRHLSAGQIFLTLGQGIGHLVLGLLALHLGMLLIQTNPLTW
ncbi:MAG: fluoride efflux transporter FluC [Pirellulaceae bacterium]